MCLAIPGEIQERYPGDGGLPFAEVRFGSVTREVCLVYTPEARTGDYVIVHVGFAIQVLDQAAAAATQDELARLQELQEQRDRPRSDGEEPS